MATLSEIKEQRAIAGAAYAAAANALIESYVELQGIEIALSNTKLNGPACNRIMAPLDVTSLPLHGDYLAPYAGSDPGNRAYNRHVEILSSVE